MQEKDHRNLLIAGVVVVVILLLVLYYAYDRCHLGKYSKKGCPQRSTGSGGLRTGDGSLSSLMS